MYSIGRDRSHLTVIINLCSCDLTCTHHMCFRIGSHQSLLERTDNLNAFQSFKESMVLYSLNITAFHYWVLEKVIEGYKKLPVVS